MALPVCIPFDVDRLEKSEKNSVTASDRLRNALRQLECAREETRDQALRSRLGDLVAEISIVLLDVEDGCVRVGRVAAG